MKKFINHILRKNVFAIMMNCVLIGSLSILTVYQPIVIEQFITELSTTRKYDALISYLIYYFILSGIVFGVGYLGKSMSKKLAWKITDQIKYEMIEKVISSDNTFFQRYSVGEMLEFLEDDIDKIYTFLSDTFVQIFLNVITLCGIFVVVLKMNIYMGFFFIIFWAIVYICVYIMQKKDDSPIYKERNMKSAISGFYGEVYESRYEIIGYRKKKSIFRNIDLKLEQLKNLSMGAQQYLYRIWIWVQFMYYLSLALAFGVGGVLVKIGVMTLGGVYLLYSYCNLLKSPVEELQYHFQNIATAQGSYKRIASILDYENGVSDGNKVLDEKVTQIRIRNLTHVFNGVKVLNNVNMEIYAGEKVVILGESGAGKSTLAKILVKLEEIQSGEIYFNQFEIKNLSIESVWKSTLYITTNAHIFSATLLENVTVFNNGISRARVKDTLEQIEICKYVNCLEGKTIDEALNFKISENRLSEGEKQFINICRIFFVEKSILILDEAMEKVTAEVETYIWKKINDFTKDNIVIYITHNANRLNNDDKVVVIENGSLYEKR